MCRGILSVLAATPTRGSWGVLAPVLTASTPVSTRVGTLVSLAATHPFRLGDQVNQVTDRKVALSQVSSAGAGEEPPGGSPVDALGTRVHQRDTRGVQAVRSAKRAWPVSAPRGRVVRTGSPLARALSSLVSAGDASPAAAGRLVCDPGGPVMPVMWKEVR